MMIKSYKPVLIIFIIMLISGYTAFYFLCDITYANAFFAGFIIILIDLLLLARYLKRAVKQASVAGFLLQSFTRWVFISICIYISLAVLNLYKWSFALGIILPFVGVFITGIYQIFRGKEDGTSS
ncbi:MAG: hypothetical protein K2N11_05605 [Mucispirillum sp.]|nr:hypothetical protein [Mucispirillum sp.]